MLRPRGTCPECGTNRAVRIPEGGDGDVRIVLPHLSFGLRCAGTELPALEWSPRLRHQETSSCGIPVAC